MTNQEAINVLLNEQKCINRNDGIQCDRKCESCDLVMDAEQIREAYSMAISALEARDAPDTNVDTISRQVKTNYCKTTADEILLIGKAMEKEELMMLLSAQPEERTETHACDLIERRAAIDVFEDTTFTKNEIRRRLSELPSTQPLVIHCTDCEDWHERQSILGFAISELPSAQPEIIQCKDCKFSHMTINGECKYCDIWFPDEKCYMSGDYYCGSAERREDD